MAEVARPSSSPCSATVGPGRGCHYGPNVPWWPVETTTRSVSRRFLITSSKASATGHPVIPHLVRWLQACHHAPTRPLRQHACLSQHCPRYFRFFAASTRACGRQKRPARPPQAPILHGTLTCPYHLILQHNLSDVCTALPAHHATDVLPFSPTFACTNSRSHMCTHTRARAGTRLGTFCAGAQACQKRASSQAPRPSASRSTSCAGLGCSPVRWGAGRASAAGSSMGGGGSGGGKARGVGPSRGPVPCGVHR